MITKSQLDEMLKNKHVTIDECGLNHLKIIQDRKAKATGVEKEMFEMIDKAEKRLEERNKSTLSFTVPGNPVSCPRMTQRDKWMKRPCVMRYREYSDRLRKFVNLNDLYVGKVTMKFYMPMPESWGIKKIQYMAGQPHRVKPDYDNLGKGVGDSLFKNDSMIWYAIIEKYWAQPGKERTELTFEA